LALKAPKTSGGTGWKYLGTITFVFGETTAIRFPEHQILAFGANNYIEREIEGLEPDVVLMGAGPSRKEIYDYTGRLMRDLHILPWCSRLTGTTFYYRTSSLSGLLLMTCNLS
jgi:hypothetical protein